MSVPVTKYFDNELTGLQIFFIYDVEYCRNEADDPKDAIIYFNPPHTPVEQQCNLCCQLMGTVHFFSSCFSPPKLLNMQKGKFAIKQEKNFVMALGGSKDMPDWVLLSQMKTLQDIYFFYYDSLVSAENSCENRKEFTNKMRNRWDCCLRMSQHGVNSLDLTFSAVPTINLRNANGKAVLQSSLDLLHSCQRKSGVIAGSVIYENKVLTSQFNPTFTYKLLMNQCAQRGKFKPEKVKISGRLPPGVQLLKVHLIDKEIEEFSTLNRYNSSHRRSSGGNTKTRNKKRPDLKILFAETKSSDELSTVTEESIVSSSNSFCDCVSSNTSDINYEQDKDVDNTNGSLCDSVSEDDSGQSEKLMSTNESISDSAFSILKDVAKKSFISASNKFPNNGNPEMIGETNYQIKQNLKKSRSYPEEQYEVDEYKVHIAKFQRRKNERKKRSTNYVKKIDEPDWQTDIQCSSKISKNKTSSKIRRSHSEATISISQKLKNCDLKFSKHNPEVMSEDSSYYSNEPSPTLGRKQWKNETDLSNSESIPGWQDMVKSYDKADYSPLPQSEEDDAEFLMAKDIVKKPPLRRKLSTISGRQIQKTVFPKFLAIKSDEINNSETISKISGKTGNNISDKISWSSSGYETVMSYDTDKEFKNIAQKLSGKDNPQVLPNGKIVPVELRILPETLKKENSLNPLEKPISQTSHISKGITENRSTSGDEKGISEESDIEGYFEKSQTKHTALTLYVQSHSNIILVLLLNDKACSESIIHSLWRIGLSCLGDISVDVHRLLDSSAKKEASLNHKYIRFNTENYTLSGDSLPLNMKVTSDKIFGRVAQLMHKEFRHEDKITDLTIALRDTMIHGHLSNNKETYYQQSRIMETPKESHGDVKPKRMMKRLEGNFGNFPL